MVFRPESRLQCRVSERHHRRSHMRWMEISIHFLIRQKWLYKPLKIPIYLPIQFLSWSSETICVYYQFIINYFFLSSKLNIRYIYICRCVRYYNTHWIFRLLLFVKLRCCLIIGWNIFMRIETVQLECLVSIATLFLKNLQYFSKFYKEWRGICANFVLRVKNFLHKCHLPSFSSLPKYKLHKKIRNARGNKIQSSRNIQVFDDGMLINVNEKLPRTFLLIIIKPGFDWQSLSTGSTSFIQFSLANTSR